ncbi:ubiquitin-like protein 3 [Penaeus monodon]|uniref:ubiquitin-like protein 3 n=1 Tax=Penaeus monodon TaxID=6687 RepID=UPI0018A71C21|nr:ubiquitin-like protein 3 [Penaeus monodon]
MAMEREEKAAVLYRFVQELQLRYWCHLENCFAFLFSLSIAVNLCCITILFYLLFSLSQINLRLILVSGKTKEFLFSPSESAGDIAQFVFDNWPEEWADESVSKAEILRLIYQGRFLHGNVTLGALGLPTGKTCVMHLVPRENLPEPNSQDQRQKSKGGTSSCCSASCAIL